MINNLSLSPKREAQLLTSGLLLVMFLGMVTGLVLVIGAIWLVAQVLILALESFLLALHTLSSLYLSSGPFIQCCLLMALAYGVYQVGKRICRRWNYAGF